MLRTRFMAAATATLLALGMTVGGAGAALASPPPAHPYGGATKIDVCHATPPDTAANGWNLLSIDDDAAATNQAGHATEHDADIIPAFTWFEKVGNGQDVTWEERIYAGKNLTATFGDFTGQQILDNGCLAPNLPTLPDPDPEDPTTVNYEVGLYLYKKLNAEAPPSWPNSGPQRFIAEMEGTEWFPFSAFPADLPQDVCGPGWAVQQDKVSFAGTFTWPETLDYTTGVDIGSPPIYGARHDNLENYMTVPACDLTTLPDTDCVVVVWKMPSWSGSQTPTWPQSFVSVHNTDCTTPISEEEIPVPNICGTQYQLDKYFKSDTTTALIAGGVLTAPNKPKEDLVDGGWGVAYRLVQIAVDSDCDPPTLPTINVVGSSVGFTCERLSGSFSVGLGLDGLNGDKLVWSTTAPGNPTLPGTVPVNTAGVVTVTVDVSEQFPGYGLNVEGGPGTVDPQTGAVTFTFTFAQPDDCPTLEGSAAISQCEQDAPYLEWTIDLAGSSEALTFPTNATLTLRHKTDATKSYTFPPFALAGPGATTGSALWPGAAIDDDGNGIAWPGWAFVDGEWVVADANFGWVRGDDVELVISVNPEIAIDVAYPNATPDCANPAIVVPDVVETDFCEGAGPNAVRVATFTVTKTENVRFFYTVTPSGEDAVPGPLTEVVFEGDETEVAIAVDPLDTVDVTATAGEGFRLADEEWAWSYTFIGAAFCPGTLPTTEAAATFLMPDCLGNPGRVTLTNLAGVIWTLDGEVVAGNSSYDVTPGTSIELTAALAEANDEFPGGFGWNDPEQVTEWNQAFPAAADDCLPTLAFTGAGALTNGLGILAVLLTVAGMGFVARRRSVEV